MKYALIIPDGAPDCPRDVLGGRTPLEVAELPALDAVAFEGRLGTTLTGADVDLPGEAGMFLSVLGYSPERFPAGEGALIAHARGVTIASSELVFCCDLVTAIDGYLRDPTAGLISAAEATQLLDALNEVVRGTGFHFHDCGGHRNLCVWENAGQLRMPQSTPVAWMVNERLERYMPRGRVVRPLRELIERAEAVLREHDVNVVRGDLGENPASAVWLWGEGPLPGLPAFEQRCGVHGALISANDVLRGIAQLIGWEIVDVAGATGLPDTNYAAKGQAGVAALDSCDLVCVHLQSPQVLTLRGDVEGKIRALEALDRHVVGPLLARLKTEADWRILVIPAQTGGASAHEELEGLSILAMAGHGIESNRGEAFDEATALEGELHPERASDLMEYFLRR